MINKGAASPRERGGGGCFTSLLGGRERERGERERSVFSMGEVGRIGRIVVGASVALGERGRLLGCLGASSSSFCW